MRKYEIRVVSIEKRVSIQKKVLIEKRVSIVRQGELLYSTLTGLHLLKGNTNLKKRRKLYSAITIIVLLAIGAYLLWQFMSRFNGDPELLKSFLDSYGEGNSAVIFLILQLAQIVFPIIPGEVLELTAGYVFGPWLGLLLCEIGVLLASIPIFFIVRIFGQKVLARFFDMERFNNLKFLQTERRLSFAVFLLFFIPGTPKDLLTYFVGLTRIKSTHFMLITVFARVPSILTSTWMGAHLGSENQYVAFILYAVAGVIGLIGFLIYKRYEKRKLKNT